MRGQVLSDQRCPLCHGKFRDTGRFLHCPSHPEQRATSFRIKFRGLCRRFQSYREAQLCLELFKGKAAEGSFVKDEYLSGRPLSLSKTIDTFLEVRKATTRPATQRNYSNILRDKFLRFAGDLRNVDQVSYGLLEDFTINLAAKHKTTVVKTTMDIVITFLRWCKKRGLISEIPERPPFKGPKPKKEILSKEGQALVINHIFATRPRREAVVITLLATYPKIRPGEIWKVQEKEIDLKAKTVTILEPKEGNEPKIIHLLDEDVALLKSLDPGIGGAYFLRDDKTGKRYSINRLRRVWLKACRELKIEGVSLYRGTKHTSITALGHNYTSALISKAAHVTEATLRNYLLVEDKASLDLYKAARPGTW